MNRCDEYRRWITEAALGELASSREPELLAHRAECDACREAYRRAREVVTLVDRGVESFVAGEPSPHFAARLRARIADEQAPGRFRWKRIGAAALATALVAFAVFYGGRQRHGSFVRPGESHSSIETAHSSAVLPRTSQVEPPRYAAAHHAPTIKHNLQPHDLARRAPASAQAEVIVPPGQLAAAMQFVAAIHSGRIDGEKLLAVQEDLQNPLEIKPIDIAPLQGLHPAASSQAGSEPGRP
jgi:hypothetical protein